MTTPSTRETEPFSPPETAVTVNVSPSKSVSLAISSLAWKESGVSSVTVILSGFASGAASFTGVTSIATSPVSIAPFASVTVKRKLSEP